jgi:signal transduction histidine kinase
VDGLDPSSTEALLELDSIPHDDWERLLEESLRVSSAMLAVESVSYWRFRSAPPSIVCELGYRASVDRLERGFVIPEDDCRHYFREIRRSQVLAIDDALHDERASDIQGYLAERGVGALLDTAVQVGGHPVGILCHEHSGGSRAWTAQEQQFAFAVGHILGGHLESLRRSEAEQNERRTALLADVMSDVAEQFGDRPAAHLAVERALPALGEMAILMAFDGKQIRYTAAAHIDPEKRVLLDELLRVTPPSPDGPGFGPHAIRERQSLLVTQVNREAARAYDITDEQFAVISQLRVRSAIAVPFAIRGRLRGAMLFASTSHRYEPHDLRFAEIYATRVALGLDNARLYREAQEAIRARDEFLSMASHELRTPLATLCLFAQAVSGQVVALSPRSVAQMSERMVRQIGRLDRLADRLLNASEIGKHRPSINRETADLAEVVDDVALAFRSFAAASGSSLVLHSPEHVRGSFDPIRLQQVLGNLIDNAIKFGMGKPIEVDVKAHDGIAAVSVRDHGPGIPLEEQRQLFTRYERGYAARGLGGLGLGLYLVREIVAAHGGRLSLETKPGEGATFTIELPLTDPARPTPDHAPDHAPAPAGH